MFDSRDIKNNMFKKGDRVKVDCLCDQEGNELEELDHRYKDFLKEGKIDSVFGSDAKGGYVYGVEGAEYCFNKYELRPIDD